MQMTSLGKVMCAVGAFATLLSGCGRSQATSFYVLTSSPRPAVVSSGQPGGQQLVVAIGPVRFPEYLDRPQITSRSSGNRLMVAEFDRWAEPLDSGFSRVLAENLSTLLSTDRLLFFPWKRTEHIDYRITIDVIRFDGGPGKEVLLNTRWTAFGPDGGELVRPRGSTIIVPTAPGFEALAEGMSKAIGDLGREIASALRGVNSP